MAYIEIAIRVEGDRSEVDELVEAVTDAVCPHETGDEPCRMFIVAPRVVEDPTPNWLRSMLGTCGETLTALDEPWE